MATTTVPKMNKTTKAIARRRSAERVAMLTVAGFLIVVALLAWRLQNGLDPVVNAATANTVDSQPVVQKRLIIKRKVVTVIEDEPSRSSAGTASSSTGGEQQSVSSAPAQQVVSTPAPAPAPVPAPTTSAS